MYWLENDRLELAKGETLTFRYRVVIHTGDAEDAGIAEVYENYCEASQR